jgi:flagellar biogenesis protein FliO
VSEWLKGIYCVEAYFISTFGETLGPIMRMAAAALVVAIVLWLLWLILRRFRSGLFVSGGGKNNLPRLAVTDAVPVDSNRRLILVRRDDVEHLIMIGGPTDIVVESGIGKPQPVIAQQPPRQPAQTTQPQAAPQPTRPEPAATPPAFQQRPPVVAAREAVADAERGRLARAPESQVPERRNDPVVATAAAPVIQPAAPPVITPPVVAPPVVIPSATNAPAASAQLTQPRGELDLDKLLDELRPNPLQDRS